MSYILEALQKSQRERELGRVPTLEAAPYLGNEKAAPDTRWAMMALGLAVIAVVVALYAALGGRFSAPDRQEQNQQQPRATADIRQPPLKPPASAVRPMLTPLAPPAFEPPAASSTQLARPAPSNAAAPPRPQAKRSAADDPVGDAPAGVTAEADPTPADGLPKDLIEDINRFKARVLRERSAESSSASSPPMAPARGPGTPAEVSAGAAVPDLQSLPSELRKRLPRYRLSVHVYAREPERRFVIMDATRMQEGDRTRGGLTLRAIKPHGVILEFEGQRFFQSR